MEDETLATATTQVVRQLYEANVIKHSVCRCNKETLRESSTMLVTMTYPEYFAPSKRLDYLVFVSPELSSVRDYVITHSVRSM